MVAIDRLTCQQMTDRLLTHYLILRNYQSLIFIFRIDSYILGKLFNGYRPLQSTLRVFLDEHSRHSDALTRDTGLEIQLNEYL